MRAPVAPARLGSLIRTTLVADVRWPKPGNVSREGPGAGMTAADFERSAGPVARALVHSGPGVGRRVWAGVAATRATVGCNTNLGILLLAAPLVEAALDPHGAGGLGPRLEGVLGRLTREDAAAAFAAIRLAAPAGLGRSPRHDVAGEADCTLAEAMAEAADRDRVARQYVTGFADVLDTGMTTLARGLCRHRHRGPALAECQLTFASRYPDSHVLRKHGPARAEALQARAGEVLERLQAAPDGGAWHRELTGFDRALKAEGLNPGTSADLTVATLLALRLDPGRARERTGEVPGGSAVARRRVLQG